MHVRRALAASIVVAALASPAGAQEADPPWSVDEASLAEGLDCPDSFAHPEREPVLLVHGTVTSGREQFGWNFGLLLPERGFDVCLVTYPDRGSGDQQESAEYVAHAIRTIHERTGSKVDVMGHSQGGVLPRWAITFWPSVRAAVDDAVLVAPPSHGTAVAGSATPFVLARPASTWQFATDSEFVRALNAGDETPGDVDWTVLYSDFDQLVQPVTPVPTSALDWGREGPNVRNVRIQDVCPGRLVDHLTIGTTDRLSQELVLDAFANDGPADPARLGPQGPLCILPDQYTNPAQLQVLAEQFEASFAGGFSDLNLTDAEPPLKPYAAARLAGPSGPSAPSGPDGPSGPSAPVGPPPPPTASPASPARPAGDGAALARTGVETRIALAAGLVAASLALRRRLR